MTELSYKLSARVKLELKEIYKYSASTWNSYQADKYHSELTKKFELISEFPYGGKQVDEYESGLRQVGTKAHLILYTVENDHVFIKYIFSSRSNIRQHFEDWN